MDLPLRKGARLALVLALSSLLYGERSTTQVREQAWSVLNTGDRKSVV